MTGDWSYKEWYEQNREEVLRRRRERYHADKEYREKQKAWSKDYQRRLRRIMVQIPFGRFSTKRPFTIALPNGAKYSCWSVGVLDKMLNRKNGYSASLERRGRIPATPIVAKRTRYYASEMIDAVCSALIPAPGQDAFDWISERWRAIPGWSYICSGDYEIVELSMVMDIDVGGPDGQSCLVQTELFGTQYFAKATGRTEGQVILWENKGVIPFTPFRLRRERLYTKEMIDIVASALKERRTLRLSDEGLRAEIQQAWDECLQEITDGKVYDREEDDDKEA